MWIENGRKFSSLQENQTRLVVAEIPNLRPPHGPFGRLLLLAIATVQETGSLTLSASL
jgi:hypothetical protein